MKKRRKKNKKQEKETGAPSSENQSPNYSWGKGATLVPRIVISSTTMEKKNSNGIQKDCRLDLPGNLSRWELVGMVMERACLVVRTSVVRVTRMAYSSPRLWLMAIGWWNKINQCRKLKLNLTQTWGVWMSLDLGMHWSQIQWYCDDKPCQERNKFRARRSKRMQSLKHSFKEVSVSHAQLAHFSTVTPNCWQRRIVWRSSLIGWQLSFFMSCSISWMASLIDNLYLLDFIVLVINWQHVKNSKRYQGSSKDPVPCKVSDSICSLSHIIKV